MANFEASGWYGGSKLRRAYGLKIKALDRDRYFDPAWESVQLLLAGHPVPATANIRKNSFWTGSCRELIAKEIGLWLIGAGKAPWDRGKPPSVLLTSLGGSFFEVSLLQAREKRQAPL